MNAIVDREAARSQILANMTPFGGLGIQLPYPGTPGTLLVHSPTAFSILNRTGEGSSGSMVAGGTLGEGRFIVFNDHQYLNMSSYGTDANMSALYTNGIDWIGEQVSGTAASKNIKVVTLSNQSNADWLTAQGYTNVVNSTWPTLASELTTADVFVAGWMGSNVSAANLQVVSDFVKGGGGLYVADYGIGYNWWWNKPIDQAGANVLLKEAGVFLTPTSFGTNPVVVDRAMGQLTGQEILDIFDNTTAATNEVKSEALLKFAKINENYANDDSLRSALNQAFEEHQLGSIQATPESPVSDSFEQSFLTAEASWLASLDLDEIPAHPTAEAVYGAIPQGAIRVNNATYSLDTNKTGWHATGFYVVPGEMVTVDVPASLFGQGFELRVNGHVDNISSRGSWKRLPYGISKSFPIDSTTIQVGNAFGGMIYVDVGGRSAGTAPNIGVHNVTISVAIESPTFVLGQMTDEEWQTARRNPAPFAELVSDRLAISLPSSVIRDLDNPTALMNYWDEANEIQDWVGAVENLRTGPSRFNLDVQISVGYLHAGYPIQGPVSTANSLADLDGLVESGSWGYFHELGHQHQLNYVLGHGYNNAWTFSGDTEVTVNIFANASLETLVPSSPENGWGYSVYPDLVLNRAKTTIEDGTKPNFEDKDPYPYYFQLADGEWGWQGYRDVMSTYVDDYLNSPNDLPSNNQEEKDQWLIRWSQVSGYDMTQYMVDNWKLEVSQSALDTVSALNLPDWMPLALDRTIMSHQIYSHESADITIASSALGLDSTATFVSVNSPSNGSLIDNGDGTYTYTPNAGYVGLDSFEATFESSAGNQQSFAISVDVKQSTFLAGDLKDGVAATDNATGNGYLLYTAATVATRFPATHPNNAEHFVAVRNNGGTWEYNTNTSWLQFTPVESDVLVASINFSADEIISLIDFNETENGITKGYASGDLVFQSNRWAGQSNGGEFEVTGSFFSFADVDQTAIGPVNNGIAVADGASGSGYLMYTHQSVYARFNVQSGNAEHVVAVRHTGSQWEYNTNISWIAFTPFSNDVLLASVDFSTDEIFSLIGFSETENGITKGFASGDLIFKANHWAGQTNRGEFEVTGTHFSQLDSPTKNVAPLNSGIGVWDAATGTGYLMYTHQSVYARFNVQNGNSQHFIAVRNNGGQWEYNSNYAWIAFTPNEGDILVASVDFTLDTVTDLKGTSTTENGIAKGYASGDLTFSANRWNDQFNRGEFSIEGTFFVP